MFSVGNRENEMKGLLKPALCNRYSRKEIEYSDYKGSSTIVDFEKGVRFFFLDIVQQVEHKDQLLLRLPRRLSAGVFIKDGSIDLGTDGQSIILNPGYGLWIYPFNDEVSITVLKGRRLRITVLLIEYGFFSNYTGMPGDSKLWKIMSGKDFGVTRGCLLSSGVWSSLGFFLKGPLKNSLDWISAESALYSLLYHLASSLDSKRADNAALRKLTDADKESVEKVYRLLLEKPEVKLTIQELGKYSGLNSDKLKKVFKALYGKTLNEFRTESRMRLAAELLKNTDLSITDVSFKAGYANPSGFSTVFRKYYGNSPREYRKN